MIKTERMPEDLREMCKIDKIFDFYQLVHPSTRHTYNWEETLKREKNSCFRCLGRNTPCINCIAARSCRDQKAYMKLEYLEDRNYLMYSIPVTIEGINYALELFQDVTGSILISNNVYPKTEKGVSVVRDFNHLAAVDSLTGLYNKDYILKELESIIARKKPEETVFDAMIDVQQLKQINETYGFGAGDQVLKKIASVLRELITESGDLLGRFAGDEFICFSRVCDEALGLERCRRLEEKLEHLMFEYEGKEFQAGVTVYGGAYQPGQDCGQFLTYLDNRLYEEKKKRREGQGF